jgi:ferredoxin-NADP reductase
MVTEISPPASTKPRTLVCGPTPFVEHVSSLLVEIGYDALAIKTERFGPTGE